MKPICTVLLITYNHVGYIRKAIESVLSQKTRYPFVIKIFDDASTDGSSDIVREYAEKHPDLIEAHIATRNQGSQTNMWNAYKSVDTKFFCVLETDDYWCDNKKLQLQIDALEEHPECSFCMHQSLIKNIADITRYQEDNTKLIKNKTILSGVIFSLQQILNMPPGSGYMSSLASRVIRTSCLNINNIKNKEAILFDNAQFYYLLLHGKVFFINKTMSVYNQTGSGIYSGASIIQRIEQYNAALLEMSREVKREDITMRVYEEIAGHILYNIDLYNMKQNEQNAKLSNFKKLEHYFIPPFIRDVFKPKTYIKLFRILFVHKKPD